MAIKSGGEYPVTEEAERITAGLLGRYRSFLEQLYSNVTKGTFNPRYTFAELRALLISLNSEEPHLRNLVNNSVCFRIEGTFNYTYICDPDKLSEEYRRNFDTEIPETKQRGRSQDISEVLQIIQNLIQANNPKVFKYLKDQTRLVFPNISSFRRCFELKLSAQLEPVLNLLSERGMLTIDQKGKNNAKIVILDLDGVFAKLDALINDLTSKKKGQN